VGTASFELVYNRQSNMSGSDSSKSVTWKHNFEPSRYNTSYGHGPLKVVAAPNILNYSLKIYYDANLGNQTPSPSPTVSSSPTATSTPVSSNNSAAVVGIVVLVVGLAVVAAVLLFRKKTVLREQ
jgi:hypothetical protein